MTVGGDKYKMEVVTYDTVYAPDKTVAAINRAVYNDSVKYGVIIGAGVHPPILPIIRETGFLDFAFAAAGQQITNPREPDGVPHHGVVGPALPDVSRCRSSRSSAPSASHSSAPTTSWARTTRKAVKAEVDKMKGKGVQFVGEEYYERGAKDFGPALLRLIAQKPDIIDTDGSPTGSIALIAKQARELGYNGYFVNSTAVLEAKAISDIAGKAGDNIIAAAHLGEPADEALHRARRAAPEEVRRGGAGHAVGDVRRRPLARRHHHRRPAPSTPRRSRTRSPARPTPSIPSARRRGAARRRTASSARSSSRSRRRS